MPDMRPTFRHRPSADNVAPPEPASVPGGGGPTQQKAATGALRPTDLRLFLAVIEDGTLTGGADRAGPALAPPAPCP